MSRRFGRNQRRRLREELAQASEDKARFETAWQRESGLLQHMRDKNERARETITEIYEMVSRHSVIVPPIGIEVDDPRRDKIHLMDVPARIFSADLDTLQTVTLHSVEVAIKDESFRKALHATLTCRGENVGYAISDEVLDGMSEGAATTLIERELAPRLVRALIRQIRSRRRL